MTRIFSTAEQLFQHVQFNGTSDAFRPVLWDLYARSDSIASLLDQMADRGSVLTINYAEGSFQAQTFNSRLEEHATSIVRPDPTVFVDPNFFDNLWFIDNLGELHRGSITRMLGHELIHALAGYEDNLAGRLQFSDPDRGRNGASPHLAPPCPIGIPPRIAA